MLLTRDKFVGSSSLQLCCDIGESTSRLLLFETNSNTYWCSGVSCASGVVQSIDIFDETYELDVFGRLVSISADSTSNVSYVMRTSNIALFACNFRKGFNFLKTALTCSEKVNKSSSSSLFLKFSKTFWRDTSLFCRYVKISSFLVRVLLDFGKDGKLDDEAGEDVRETLVRDDDESSVRFI